MHRILSWMFAAWCCAAAWGADMALTPLIVLADGAASDERHAADELASFLGQAAGADWTILPEGEWDGRGPALLCGPTEHAARHFPESRDLAAEEWLLAASPEGHLVVAGGRPRGVLYGAYEYLERFAGCRFLAVDAVHVPRFDAARFPTDLRLRGKPFFRYRLMSIGVVGAEAHWIYYARLRLHGPRQIPAARGGWAMFGSPNRCHTFGLYAKYLPQDRPELFALDARGERPVAADGRGPGQLCLSHPETRRLIKAQLRTFIEADRARAAREGAPPPEIYDLSQNDNEDYCRCPGCAELEKRYGAQSGVLLDFINDIADDIKDDYPELLVQTFAYQYTEEPPQGIRPRANVLMLLAALGSDLRGRRDTMRSIEHPNNAGVRRMFTAWSDLAQRLGTWDYGKLWEEQFPSPYTFVRGVDETVRFYAEHKVVYAYLETEVWGPGLPPRRTEIQNFTDLKNYLYVRLLLDPHADAEAVIADFMDHFYGPAASAMTAWLDYLERRMAEEPGRLGGEVIARRRFLDRDFFLAAETMLARAEALVEGDAALRTRVRQERFMVDYALANLWETVVGDGAFPVTREAVLARLAEVQDAVRARYFEQDGAPPDPEMGDLAAADAARLALLSMPRVPRLETFRGKPVVADFPWTAFAERRLAKLADDPDARGGKAMRLSEYEYDNPDAHTRPFELGVYDNDAKKILGQRNFPLAELPQDEKYHWLVLPDVPLAPNVRMWSHWTWAVTPAPIREAYSAAAPGRRYDMWVSAKFEGPAYVPGSQRRNAVWMDQVVLVPADAR